MKKYAVIFTAVLWSALTMTSLPASVFAQGVGGGTSASPSTTMPMSPTTKSAPVTTAATTMAPGIHGNKKSHAYHLPDCPSYAKVSATNLVTFATEDEAVKAGFHKAKSCPK